MVSTLTGHRCKYLYLKFFRWFYRIIFLHLNFVDGFSKSSSSSSTTQKGILSTSDCLRLRKVATTTFQAFIHFNWYSRIGCSSFLLRLHLEWQFKEQNYLSVGLHPCGLIIFHGLPLITRSEDCSRNEDVSAVGKFSKWSHLIKFTKCIFQNWFFKRTNLKERNNKVVTIFSILIEANRYNLNQFSD